ncbi:MAG: hypothetical protein FJ403_21280 [Verrucomicrobia bacterium]|nr:hypothetical protein [Verrucomicrobiota bacterium]
MSIGIDLLFVVLGLIVGFGAGWFSYRGRQMAKQELAESEFKALKDSFNALQIEYAKTAERSRLLDDQLQVLQTELAQERQFNISMHAELSRERANRGHLEQKIEHQKADLLQLQQRLSEEFKSLVHQVLDEKSQTLTDINKANLDLLLQPISDKLQDFKQKIEEQHYRETREFIVLHNKLANLESSRWSQAATAPPPAPPAVSTAGPAVTESSLDANDPFIEYMPPAHEPSSVPEPDAPMIQVATPDVALEGDGYHSFSPKQQVEIDNFLKRTLGRVPRKKSAG